MAWHLLPAGSRVAVEVAERYADGKTTRDELQAVRDGFRAAPGGPAEVINGIRYRTDFGGAVADADATWAAQAGMRGSADAAAWAACRAAGGEVKSDRFSHLLSAEMAARRLLLWDVVGPPTFRPVRFDPRWRSANSVALARAIYEDRAFERLPILADALIDSGCDEDIILAHCRSDGPHIRGCWAVDLVIAKE
jgi:hypothetical protein